jgi:hypothetical protein
MTPMPSSRTSKSETVKFAAKTVGRLFFMDLAAGRILTSNPDGSHLETIVSEGRRLAPAIGEHNDEVLKELGFTDDDIAGLRVSGTVPHALHLESTTGGAR